MLYRLQLMGEGSEGRILRKGALYKSVREWWEGFGGLCLYHSHSHATLPHEYTKILLPSPPSLPECVSGPPAANSRGRLDNLLWLLSAQHPAAP